MTAPYDYDAAIVFTAYADLRPAVDAVFASGLLERVSHSEGKLIS